MSAPNDRFARFGGLHRQPEPLLLPNAWDYASAAALFAAGFPAVATTSLGVAAAAGKPDGSGATRRDTLDVTRLIAPLGLLTVDAERGFSDDPHEVADLAAELLDCGAAGVNLEDGVDDRALVDPDPQAATIAAVKRRVPELFVNARVDTYWTGACATVADTLERARRYSDAGADGIFVPGVRRPADVEALVAGIDRPLNVLFIPGLHTIAELRELGVKRISTGSLLFRASLHTAVDTAAQIRSGSRDAGADAPAYADVQRLVQPRTGEDAS